MRRSATEVIHNLERRIARLEKQSSIKGRKAEWNYKYDFVPHRAQMSFDLIQDEDEVGGSERDALSEVKSMLRVRKIDNEGHGRMGELICSISVNDLKEVARIVELVQRNLSLIQI